MLSSWCQLKVLSSWSLSVLAAEAAGSGFARPRLSRILCMGRHTVSKLIGSPPGYVGYDEAGPGDTRGSFQTTILGEGVLWCVSLSPGLVRMRGLQGF